MTFGNSWLLLWWMTEADQRCSAKIGVLKKMKYSQVFSCEICQIFKNSYFEEHLQMAVSRMKKLRSWGRFNNYVTLKLPFLTHLPPPSRFVTFVHENTLAFTFVHENTLALLHGQHKHPPPPNNNNNNNNTKKAISLKSKTCHYCQSVVQTGSIPSKTGVHICNLYFSYTKILHWNFFLPWRHGI